MDCMEKNTSALHHTMSTYSVWLPYIEPRFCHVSSLRDGEGSVREGDTCSFKVEYDDRKGKDKAIKVRTSAGPARQRPNFGGLVLGCIEANFCK